ncbi:MAG: hypothetical protein ACXACK_16795 [Candidatus Hodarchaeales archaeon]|jgi:hypothetical protein
MFYNLRNGENTVLRGLVAEEAARYILTQRYPILVLRPKKALNYLDSGAVEGRSVEFLRKNQKTMDFFGIFPFFRDKDLQMTTEEIICKFFLEKEGLDHYITKESFTQHVKGFVIEVKSRTTENTWAPFNFGFSSNQKKMFNQCQQFDFTTILCGVTFAPDWNLSIVFCDINQRIFSDNFLASNQ